MPSQTTIPKKKTKPKYTTNTAPPKKYLDKVHGNILKSLKKFKLKLPKELIGKTFTDFEYQGVKSRRLGNRHIKGQTKSNQAMQGWLRMIPTPSIILGCNFLKDDQFQIWMRTRPTSPYFSFITRADCWTTMTRYKRLDKDSWYSRRSLSDSKPTNRQSSTSY